MASHHGTHTREESIRRIAIPLPQAGQPARSTPTAWSGPWAEWALSIGPWEDIEDPCAIVAAGREDRNFLDEYRDGVEADWRLTSSDRLRTETRPRARTSSLRQAATPSAGAP